MHYVGGREDSDSVQEDDSDQEHKEGHTKLQFRTRCIRLRHDSVLPIT